MLNLEMMEKLARKYKDTGISLEAAYALEIKKEESAGTDTSK